MCRTTGGTVQTKAHLSECLSLLVLFGCIAVAVPAGGLFEFVSCPHYLAEIVIYLGLLVASGGQLMPLLMLVWVVSSQ